MSSARLRSDLGVHLDAVLSFFLVVNGDEADRPAAHGAILDIILRGAAAGIGIGLERFAAMGTDQRVHARKTLPRPGSART